MPKNPFSVKSQSIDRGQLTVCCCCFDWVVDRYTSFLLVHVLCMVSRPTGRPAHCLRLRLVFYHTPLNFNFCAIFSDELKNTINKIVHSLPIILHLSDDFSNLRRTQHSIISIQSGCTNVVAYVPPVKGIKPFAVHPNELPRT